MKLLWHLRYFFYHLIGFPLNIGSNANIFPHVNFKFINGGSITIGNNCMIEDYAIIATHGGNIKIGDNFGMESFSILYGAGGLTIGNNVIIAAHTVVIPSNHNFDRLDLPINHQGVNKKGITIKDDVWIGTGCKILAGVVIGKGVVIGAGSTCKPLDS